MAARSRGPPRPTANRDKRAGKIRCGVQAGAGFRARRRIARKTCDRVEPPGNLRRIGQRRRQSLGEQPRSGRGHGAVDGIEQGAAPVSGQRAHQFEIAAGRLIDRHAGPGALAQGRRHRRPLADLRAFDIGHARCGGRDLKPCQRAESLAGRHCEERGQPPLGGGAVENVARERGYRRQRAPERGKVGLAVKRVRNDDFAGLEPRDLGGQRCPVAFGNAEFAGRNIDPGKREAASSSPRQPRARDCEQIIVPLRIEERIFGERAGRDQAHDVTPNDAFGAALACLGRILKLLAHGDAVALRDQTMQIFVGALDRHAAHRNVGAEMLAALGQHDAERA